MDVKREQESIQVSTQCIIVNIILSAFKLFAGFYANSSAMVSDAAESFSDVFSSLIVIAGVKLAGKQADKEHPYGHDRFESVAAIILAILVFATGIAIGRSGVLKIVASKDIVLEAPGVLALIAAVLTIIIKEGMYWYVKARAKRIESSILMASAWHHRSDAISSIGTFLGILGSRLGLPVLDPIASVITCLFIFKSAIDIFINAIGGMTDKACDDSFVEQMHAFILEQPFVLTVDQIKTRRFGDRVYVDIEIGVNKDATLEEAHSIAHQVHDALEAEFKKVKHCMVHINPAVPEAEV